MLVESKYHHYAQIHKQLQLEMQNYLFDSHSLQSHANLLPESQLKSCLLIYSQRAKIIKNTCITCFEICLLSPSNTIAHKYISSSRIRGRIICLVPIHSSCI